MGVWGDHLGTIVQVGVDDPVTCASMREEAWPRQAWMEEVQEDARRQQTLIRMAKQSKLHSYRTACVSVHVCPS
jgi:hypothetical protein